MRLTTTILVMAGVTLAGCAQPVPQSNPGVGFANYSDYEIERARREAALNGQAPAAAPLPTVAPVGAVPPAAVPPGGIASSELAAAGIGTGAATGASPTVLPIAPSTTPTVITAAGVTGQGGAPALGTLPPIPGTTPAAATVSATAPLQTANGLPTTAAVAPSTAPPTALPGTTGLQTPPVAAAAAPVAVAGAAQQPEWNPAADPLRQSGLEANPTNAAPALVTGPQATPATSAGPNIVDYALNAPNARGQEYYSRFIFAGEGRMLRNCGDYATPDDAQRDFLARGGPERDPRGIDPDGDGFACAWDPAPFRAAVGRG